MCEEDRMPMNSFAIGDATLYTSMEGEISRMDTEL